MIKKPKAWERVKIARMIERPTALEIGILKMMKPLWEE